MVTKIKEFLFQNKNTSQTVAKNAFWLFSGQFLGKLLRAVLVIYAARVLGPASWGAFSYVMSLIAFMLIFLDLGMTAIVTRESSKDIENSKKYFSTVFFVKIVLLILGILILIFGAPFLTKIKEAKSLLPIAAVILIFDSLRNFGFSLSRAMQKMQLEALNEIVTNLFITAFGFYFLYRSPNSGGLVVAYLIGTAGGFSITLSAFGHYFKDLLTHFDFKIIKSILSASLPFALASFLGAIMINTDLIMLGWMRSAEELGFYSAAQKPVLLLYVLASLLATSLFPALSKITADKEKFKALLEKTLAASLLFAVPAAVGGLILANQIIPVLFGNEYQPAVLTFQILMATLIIIFPSVIISNALLTQNKQKNFIKFSVLGAFGNVLFNFILIPFFGIVGCAISTIFTQIIANAFIWKKMKGVSDFKILPGIKKIIIASLAIIPILLFFKSIGINLFINIAIAIAFYFVLLKIQKEDLLKILQ